MINNNILLLLVYIYYYSYYYWTQHEQQSNTKWRCCETWALPLKHRAQHLSKQSFITHQHLSEISTKLDKTAACRYFEQKLVKRRNDFKTMVLIQVRTSQVFKPYSASSLSVLLICRLVTLTIFLFFVNTFITSRFIIHYQPNHSNGISQ